MTTHSPGAPIHVTLFTSAGNVPHNPGFPQNTSQDNLAGNNGFFARLFSPRALWIFALIVYFGMSAFSVQVMLLKQDGLSFHQKDFNYFMEQAARLADPGLTNRFATNIEGYNFVGLQGIEGAYSIFQAIHNEYFRYTYAVLYYIFKNTLPIYIFYALVFYLPVLYSLWAARPPTIKARLFLLGFILLYAFFPGEVLVAGNDLRGRLLLPAAWCMAVMAVYFERPFAEKLVLLTFLPFLREEGIVLGVIITTLNFLRMRGKPGQVFETRVFSAVLFLALAAFVVFMYWGGYRQIDSQYTPLNIVYIFISNPILVLLLALGIAAAAVVFIRIRRQPDKLNNALFCLGYATIFVLTGAQFLRDFNFWYSRILAQQPVNAWDIYQYLFTWDNFYTLYTVIIVLFPLLGATLARRWREPLLIVEGLLACLMIASSMYFVPLQVDAWRARIPPARLVWDFKVQLDRYHTRILVDFNTYQAFYNVENVLVYNRVPVWMVGPNHLRDRFYPQDKDLVAKAIAGGIEYAVIGRESLADVQELAQLSGRQALEIGVNETYLILQFR